MRRVAGKVVLVTGAGSAVPRRRCSRQKSATVIVTDVNRAVAWRRFSRLAVQKRWRCAEPSVRRQRWLQALPPASASEGAYLMITWWVNLSPSLIVICWKPSSFSRSKKFASSAIVRSWKNGERRDMVVMFARIARAR